MRTHRVVIVDDEEQIRSLVASYLESDGFEVIQSADAEAGLEAIRRHEPDVVVLDVRMPGMDGFEALGEIRKTSDVFVIMLTARAEEIDRVVGLSMGADDYVTKPFSPRELVARVKAVLRRDRSAEAASSDRLDFEGLSIDLARREVTVATGSVDLTALQFDLLAALAQSPGRVFTRRQIIERVWGWDYFGDERIVDVHVRNLRKALGDDAGDPTIVGTVRGVGYRMLAEPS
jgi:DNA-binding response OmpR family regulator